MLFTVLRLPQMTFFYGFFVKALKIFIAIGMLRVVMLRIAPRLRSVCRVIPEAFCEACIEACIVWASDVIDDKRSLAARRYHVTASESDSDRLNR